MDVSKHWMDTPRHEKEYQLGVEKFLHFAFSSTGVPQGKKIQCPCAKCCNRLWLRRHDVYDHLICNGFIKGYRRWFNHGKSLVAMDVDSDTDGEYNCNDNIDELLRDRFRDTTQVNGQNMEPNESAKEFYKFVDEASQELYPGCKGFTRTIAWLSSLEKKMDGVYGLLKVLVHQVNPGMSDEEVAALGQATQNSLLDVSSSRPKNTPHSSESTHIPPKDDDSGENNFVQNR
ncbi:uncharacterized protein [Arachis hypogaea]|uniref:uncharacterized protein n=1 Tax=Arachis hypogaea TaxID=3818 RepID=UPI003B225E7A